MLRFDKEICFLSKFSKKNRLCLYIKAVFYFNVLI